MRRICGDWWDVKRGDIALGTQLVGCGRGDLAAGGLRVAYAHASTLTLLLSGGTGERTQNAVANSGHGMMSARNSSSVSTIVESVNAEA